MLKCRCFVTALFAAIGISSAAVDATAHLVGYTYTVNRRVTEKKAGSLYDGDLATGLRWHTKFKATTEIVCELSETHQIDKIEINASKWTKWYIISKMHVEVDDGIGGFGTPVILPGLAPSPKNQKALRDASCTNHLFTASGLGKAVRVKVTVFSDAAANICEIRLYGKPLKRQSASMPSSSLASEMAMARKRGDFRKLENSNWRLEFNPLGGRAMSVYSKSIGVELTNPELQGSFVEEVWDRRKSHQFLINQPYVMTYDKTSNGEISATATGNAQGGGIDFLKVIKRFTASDDSTSLRVDYTFENIPEAMALQNYGMLLHTTLGVFGRDVTCYYPTTEGIVAVYPGKRGNEYWGHRPARGWIAAATDDGIGVVVTMPFKDVKTFYSWFSKVPTLEWRMIPVGIEAGGGYNVSTEIIPFKGLKTVSGAGGGFVGSICDGTCTVVSSRAGTISAEVDGKARVLKFSKPGDSVAFATSATTIVLRAGDKEVCRLEARPAKGDWVLGKECEQRGSSVAEVDLTCYTNFPRTVCTSWGKPLAGRRLKVAVLTGAGNQIEIGRLAERFDFDYRTVGVLIASGYAEKRRLGNPVFSDGNNFSLVNTSDLERGMVNVLKYDADVVLVGGVPFEALTKELKEILLKKVNGGTGLVWIGQDRDVPELGFKLKSKKTAKAVPVGCGGCFASVPFELLGKEEVYAPAASVGATVHATCGGNPYVMESVLGKGRIINLSYRALTHRPWPSPGLTPAALCDFYETGKAPVEHYYSLVAKSILRAAGRTLPVSLGECSISKDGLRCNVIAQEPKTTRWEWRVTEPFGSIVASGERDVSLAGERQEISLDLPDLPAIHGPLAFELIVRDKNGIVQDWGAWAFANEPKAVIASLKLDETWRNEGELTSFTAKIDGDAAGMRLEVSLVDSYGRTLEKLSPKAQKDVKGAFRIFNMLPARCYTVEAKLFAPDGKIVSRRHAELRVRPETFRYAWNDFEVGIWASTPNRSYLWPDFAKIFYDIGISTVIANPESVQLNFTMRYNIHPTLLADAGLRRSPEPKEYSDTGDKMKLVRGTCLSSPDFFAKREKRLEKIIKTLPRYALRFVWFGDEQSITGYGGTAVDFCFSEHCLKELRKFLKGRYRSIERLNAEWETSFPDWDSVVPFTRQEVWATGGRHVAGWSDHLEFMDSRLTNSIAFSVRAMHGVDPAVKFALSGTQQPSAYGGMDWWKILGTLDAALSYRYGGQLDIHRSFCPNGGFMPWAWGYSRRGNGAVAYVWRTAFSGARGLMGFQSSSQINNDWTYSIGLRDTVPHVHRLVSGTGMHFVNNLATRHDVAILYSQSSLRAAFIEKRREEHDKLEEKMRRLLMNLGYAYDYVSYEQLGSGYVTSRGYRVLVLADALAMSDEEVKGVKAFAAAGGTVIAEGMPAVRTANCRRRKTSPLADLFKGSRHTLFPKIDVEYLKAIDYPEKPEFAQVVEKERSRYGAALERAGVIAGCLGIVNEDTGKSVLNANVYPKSDASGNNTWCVLASASDKGCNARFVFPRKCWTYDLVSGRAYGNVKELRLPLRHGMPYSFAQYSEKISLTDADVKGQRISIAYSMSVDGAVRLNVFRPDGSEAYCYAKNVLVKAGRAEYEIPFALSDPKGNWKVRIASIFGNESREVTVKR